MQTSPAPLSSPPTAPAPLAVVIDDVSKRYGRRWALARLSYSLPRGRSLLLTGHNGSGKTTLMKILATSLRPTAGSIRVLGLNPQDDLETVRRRIALLSHASFLYEDLTAEQNLTVFGRLLGLDQPRARALDMLPQVGLGERVDTPVRQFSAGMRKRLAIARLLLKTPELALLDEPFGELDPSGIAQMEKLIAQLRDRGATVILATHLIEQGQALCEERLHLEQGRAVAP